MTQEQKTAILAALSSNGLESAGHAEAARRLNAIEIEGESVVSEEKKHLSKPEILALLSDSSLIGLMNFFELGSDQARAFKYRWESLENLDLTHPVSRDSIQSLMDFGVVQQAEAAAILAYGERARTKADELLGRLMTSEDIEEARS